MLYLATAFGYPGVPCLQLMILLVLYWDFRLLAGDLFPSSATSPLVKYGVLKSQNTFQRAYWTFPLVLTGGICFAINVFYVLFKAADNFKSFQEGLELYVILPIAFGAGGFVGLIWLFVVGPIADPIGS